MIKKEKILLFFLILFLGNIVVAEQVDSDVEENLEVGKYLEVFEEYTKENNIEGFDVNTLYNDLITGNGIEYKNILDILVSNITKQVTQTLKSSITIFIIVIITAIITSLELDKDSDVIKITRLVVFISLSAILLKNYLDIVVMFKNIVNTISYIMQVASTFLLGILLATGKITSTGIVQPLLLFVSNFICVITEYVIIPCFTFSIAINIISRISENIKMNNLASMFRKASLYIFSSIIGIFLVVLSMETTITKSMDGLYYKTAQDIVSNAVPVVGGFLSDSLDTVLSATKLIGKVGGIVALIASIIIVSIPVVKLVIIVVIYNLLISFSEPINEDSNIQNFIRGFASVYKDMLGILIGIMTLFIISTGIIMSIVGTVNG